MNNKTTRRALFLSFVSMFLCFTMLIGTTYAWFTDEVTSGVNQIVAGNLDVELTHTNDKVNDADVQDSTELFKLDKWEPGAMAWENFTVKNAGDLALKYQFVLEGEAVGEKDLRNVIKVAVLDRAIDPTTDTRDTLKSETFVGFDELAPKAGEIKKDAASQEQTFGVVLYWAPSANDNDYNMNNANLGKKLSINVFVKLYATQLEAENDSFGDDYDKDSKYPVLPATTNKTYTAADEATDGYVAPAASDLTYEDGTALEANAKIETKVELKSAADNVFEFEITAKDVVNDKDVKAVNGAFIVPVEIAAGLDNISIKHDGVAMTRVAAKTDLTDGTFYYDYATGIAYICSATFSPFTIEVANDGNAYVMDAATLIAAAAEGKDIVLGADIDTEGVAVRFPEGAKATLDLNGNTLTSKDGGNGNWFALYVSKNSELTLEDSVGGGEIVSSCYGVYVQQNAKFTMNGGTIKVSGNEVYDMGVVLWNSELVMNAGKLAAKHGVWPYDYYADANECKITISENAVFESTCCDIDLQDAKNTVLDVPETLVINGLEFVSTAEELLAAIDADKNVTLIRDIVLTETVTVPADKSLVIDLGGYDITTEAQFAIKNEGNLTIKGDGTVSAPYAAYYSTGVTTIEGGSFESSNGFGAIFDNIYGTEPSVATINGGTFTGVGIYNPTEVTINGGTFNVGRDPDGASDHISDKMTLFISPTFHGVTNTAVVTLTGGTFNGDVYVYDDGITETTFVNNGAIITGEILDNA